MVNANYSFLLPPLSFSHVSPIPQVPASFFLIWSFVQPSLLKKKYVFSGNFKKKKKQKKKWCVVAAAVLTCAVRKRRKKKKRTGKRAFMHFALRSLSETARISRSLSRALTSPTIYSGGVIAKKKKRKRKKGKKKKNIKEAKILAKQLPLLHLASPSVSLNAKIALFFFCWCTLSNAKRKQKNARFCCQSMKRSKKKKNISWRKKCRVKLSFSSLMSNKRWKKKRTMWGVKKKTVTRHT